MRLPSHLRSLAATALLATSFLGLEGVTHASPAHRAVHQSGTTIAFGRQGGNIRPFTVTINASGTIQVSGPVQSRGVTRIPKDAVKGLLKLAKAERFSSLPAHITGTNVLPDIASLYITITTVHGSTTVSEHGAKNGQFDQLFDVLMAVAGTSF